MLPDRPMVNPSSPASRGEAAHASSPLVSIVTPAFNAEPFLAQCIESVLAQTHTRWEHTIVNNCSTDRTLEIAQAYARQDSRIRVHSNERFVDVIENHNIACRHVSQESRYCKFLLADDFLFPSCLADMVRLAETHPSVGVVGAYGLRGSRVAWDGLPFPSTVVPGRDLCRATLLQQIPYVLGTPTSVLFRSDLLRSRPLPFNPENLHADTELCLDLLRHSDFGFIHQVLTFTRSDDESLTSYSVRTNTYLPSYIEHLLRLGPSCLTPEEQAAHLRALLDEYYQYLASSALHRREKAFWNYHRAALRRLGYPLNLTRLSGAVLLRLADNLKHPLDSLLKLVRILRPTPPGRAHAD
jgi:glycosyltransferase involved in cell wall biosynthesis